MLPGLVHVKLILPSIFPGFATKSVTIPGIGIKYFIVTGLPGIPDVHRHVVSEFNVPLFVSILSTVVLPYFSFNFHQGCII